MASSFFTFRLEVRQVLTMRHLFGIGQALGPILQTCVSGVGGGSYLYISPFRQFLCQFFSGGR